MVHSDTVNTVIYIYIFFLCSVIYFVNKYHRLALLCFLTEVNSPLVFQHTAGMTHLRSSLRVCEIGAVREMLGPRRDEVTGQWTKLHNKALTDK